MSSTTITLILSRLQKDQRTLFDQWQKSGSDEIDSVISAILREQPPRTSGIKDESSRGKLRLLQEGKKISLPESEIKLIVDKFRPARTPGKEQLKKSFESLFIEQGKHPDEAARLAEIAAGNRTTRII